MRLTEKIAIVTGSSSGIGQGIATALAQEGAKVGINYHSNEDGAQTTLRAVEEAGSEGIIVQADVSRPEDVQRMLAQVIDTWGRLDILVSNAGRQKDAAFLEMSYSDWQAVVDTDLNGQFVCAQAAARQFVRQQGDVPEGAAIGKIICMSSVHDTIPWAGHANYAAAKGGVLMLMKTLAQELGAQRIRVNGLAPGAIKTPINQEVWNDAQRRDKLRQLIPYGRLGTTEDIGKAAVWLASDESDYVHGQMLYVDGGMTLYPGFIGNG